MEDNRRIYTRNFLVAGTQDESKVDPALHYKVTRAEQCAKSLLSKSSNAFILWPFHDAPEPLRTLCNLNGGDEDYLIITERSNYLVTEWIDRLAPDEDIDTYLLIGVTIYVTSHG